MKPHKSAPKLCRHKAKNLGYSTDPRTKKQIYFGTWGHAQTIENYQRWASEFLKPEEFSSTSTKDKATIGELLERYLVWSKRYYRVKGSTKVSTEFNCVRQACKEMVPWFDVPTKDFKPSDLITIRSKMVERDAVSQNGQPSRKKLRLTTVNAMITRIRRMFKRGVEWELVPADVYQAISCVQHLSWRTAPELEEKQPIKPVDFDIVRQAFPFMNQKFRLMLRVHMFTGMRTTEVCGMRWSELKPFNESLYLYAPETHKTAHHGISKAIYLPVSMVDDLRKLNRTADDKKLDHVFLSWGKGKSAGYKGPVQPSGYRTAIERAQERLAKHNSLLKIPQIPRWTLLQIRHTVATIVRQLYGLEGAQAVLGHASIDATQIYAERRNDLAVKIASERTEKDC